MGESIWAATAQAVDAVGALAGTLGASSAQMKAGLTLFMKRQAVERVACTRPPENSDNGDAEYHAWKAWR
ncbi:MAG: hypothetical protein ACLUBZ_16555 [Ruthenibacterium lactatiformans]|uniref:hypothetical protein n=1 Tax=Ruthenibacterium lactatiformans TaxID=1550024 RepID=UPI003994F89E